MKTGSNQVPSGTTRTRGRRAERDAVFLARGGAVTLIGSIGAYALGLLFNILVARKIGASAYGLYALGLTVVMIGSTFSALGLARGSQRFIAIHLADGDEKRLRGTITLSLALGFAAGIITSLLLVTLAPTIAVHIFHDAGLTRVLRILSISLPFIAALDTLGKMTQGFKVMRYKVYYEDLFQNALKVVVGVVLLAAGWHLDAVLLAQVIPAVVATILLTVALHRIFPFATGSAPITLEPRGLLKFSIPLHVSTVTRFMQGRTELLVLGALGTAQAAGIYNISLRVSIIGAMMINAFIAIAAPMITTLHHEGDTKQLETVFKLITKWLVVVNLPLTLTIILLSDRLLDVFGKEFSAGALALSILAIGRMIDAATGIGGAMINMVGRSDVSALNAFVAVIVSLVFDFLLIPPYGLLGAAIAATLGIAVINGIRLAQIYRWFKFHPASFQMWKPVVAGVVALAVGLVARDSVQIEQALPELFFVAAAIWLSYIVALVALGLDETDAAIWRSVRSKLRVAIRARSQT